MKNIKKILFFDDEPFVMSYTVRNLMDCYGWTGDKEIVLVSTIQDLLTEINSIREVYSLFVLDVMTPMPSGELTKQFTQLELDEMHDGMSTGLVIATKIRQMDHYTNIPILFLTARNIPPIPDEEKAYTAFIRKPVFPEEISKKMDELLGTK